MQLFTVCHTVIGLYIPYRRHILRQRSRLLQENKVESAQQKDKVQQRDDDVAVSAGCLTS